MAGALTSTDNWFRNPAAQASTTYGVGLKGERHQYVALDATAWGNGILEPGETWTRRFGSGWPNARTVNCETEDAGNPLQPVTDAEYEGVRDCGRLAIQRFPSIVVVTGHVVISPQSRAHCPGDRWIKSGRLAQLAKDLGRELYLP